MALHMSTILSRTTSNIISHLSEIRSAFSPHVTLFTLSVSPQRNSVDISGLVSTLTALSDQSVGCLSAAIPSGNTFRQEHMTCSVAVFDKQSATPFLSTVPGRQAPQVGRWHSFRKRDQYNQNTEVPSANEGDTFDWERIWARDTEDHVLPEEIQSVKDQLDTVLYLSDGSPEGLFNALHTLPTATNIGLIASSTPFITRRPFTLFKDKSVYSSGAVGLALTSSSPPRSHLKLPGLEVLTAPLTVTESEGNLVHSLDNSNPTRLLLSAIERRKADAGKQLIGTSSISKEDVFYVATLHGPRTELEVQQLYHITSGDPSRGTLAIECDSAPPKGTLVQLFQLPAHSNPDTLSRYISASAQSASRKTMAFIVSPSDLPFTSAASEIGEESIVLQDTFLAASENGFIVDRHHFDNERERPWMCKVPGAVLDLRWNAL